MPQPIQHHTVPAGYLSGFLGEGETTLHVYSRDDRHFRGRPDVLSSRRYYYAVRRVDGIVDNTIEDVLANDVEHAGLQIIRKLCNGEQITVSERSRLALYMAVQYLRTPHMRDNIEQTFAVMLDGFARRHMRNPKRFAADMAIANNLKLKEAEKLAEQARAAYLRGDIKLNVKPEFSLEAMFEHCNPYAEFVGLGRWEVITFPDADLITSDCPVHFRDPEHVALADPETIMHFPLSCKNMLVVKSEEPEDVRWERLYSIVPEQHLAGFMVWHNYVYRRNGIPAEAEEFNRVTASMCREYIYCPDANDSYATVLRTPSKNVTMKATLDGKDFRISLETEGKARGAKPAQARPVSRGRKV